jgi:hypothetical protein
MIWFLRGEIWPTQRISGRADGFRSALKNLSSTAFGTTQVCFIRFEIASRE